MNETEVVSNPLLPDGIEGLNSESRTRVIICTRAASGGKLRCVICTKEVPARRDKDVKDWKFEEFTA